MTDDAITGPQDVRLASSMTAPVRVLRIVTRMNIGGPAIHVALLSNDLDPTRYSTRLVVGEPDATEGDLSDSVRRPEGRVIRLKALRRPMHPWRDVMALGQLLRMIWTERPCIIHTHMAKAGTLGRVAGLLYNILGPGRQPGARAVLVHTFHGHVLEGYFPSWQSQVFLAVERWLARRTDCLIAVSPRVRDELLDKGIGRAEQWRVVPLGLDLAALATLAVPGGHHPVRFGIVGRLVPIKNPTLFLEALSTARRLGGAQHVRGLVVGDGMLRAGLELRAQRLQLDGAVRFVGWQRDMVSTYQSLEAACVTSWNEGTPVALIEAMAAGRVAISTDVGGVRDLLDDSAGSSAIPEGSFRITARGILVRPGDADGLAAAIQTVAGDPALRRQLGEAARAHVLAHHSAQRLVTDIEALYTQLRQPGRRDGQAHDEGEGEGRCES